MQSLATAIEAKFITTDAALTASTAPLARGKVGEVVGSTNTGVTGTETVIFSCTFTAVAGRRYKFTADFTYYQATGGAPMGDTMYQKIRVIAGATPTATGGTVIRGKTPNCSRDALFLVEPGTLVGTWVAPSSGTYAASFTARMLSTTGGIYGDADASWALLVEDVGL
jgi:hypothetical protein